MELQIPKKISYLAVANQNLSVMKRIVIVGATSGLGLETARLCIREGWRVGAAGRRIEALETLRAEAPDQVEIEPLDVTRDDAPNISNDSSSA